MTNYTEEKTRIENEIKRLQNELETLEKQSKKEEWKKTLVEKFKEFLEIMDSETAAVEIRALRDDNAFILNLECYEFCNFEPENPEKVETEPTAEPKAEETNEPKTERPAEKPENKIVVASVPKPNETPEEKPVKMKMTLDEFIDSLPEPAQK